jgi:predicted GIY-YIG superfamily endonuclease
MSWHCYLLATCDGRSEKTYVGVTPDLDRRLRQHNGEISGGARATTGRKWERICHVRGFPDHRAALQFEWRFKQVSRGLQGAPLVRRLRALQILLGFEKSTTAAVEYAAWDSPPEVVIETERELPTL